MKITRRHLQIALGLLWLADGLLQLQPFMFTPGFAHQILDPAGDGQPGWVGGPVHFLADHVAQHPALFNSVAVASQLALGAGFLLRRTVRTAVIASIAWSVGIWWFGEGLGGLASGHATLLTGAPGAAILYGVLAAASWPRRHGRLAGHGTEPAPWLPWIWATIWLGGVALQLLPGQSGPTALAELIRSNADGAPGWLAATDRTAATAVAHAGTAGFILEVTVTAAVGVAALIPGRLRMLSAYAGAGLAAVFWLVGQDLGQLYTGQATDPNSAVMMILFAIAVAGSLDAVPGGAHRHQATHALPRPQAHVAHLAGSGSPMPVRT